MTQDEINKQAKKRAFEAISKLIRPEHNSDTVKITYIALYYDWEAQSRQCIEEMAELTKAINKLWRYDCGFLPTNKTAGALQSDIIEEIVDVSITLAYLLCLLSFEIPNLSDTYEAIRNEKLNREIQRIKEREAKE